MSTTHKNAYIKVTRIGASIIQGEDPKMILAKKTINYVTTDDYGHVKTIMHRGAIKVEETISDILEELYK